MALSARLLLALKNLERKRAGVDVDWINIADARELTLLGLAKRDHQGWSITEAGLEAYQSQFPSTDVDAISGEVIPQRPV